MMNMKFILVSAMLMMLAATISRADNTKENPDRLWAIGTAWTQDGAEIQYLEYHYAEQPGLDLPTLIEYRRPDGEVFARKQIDYSRSLIAPAIVQQDFRNKARLVIEHPDEPAARFIRVGFQPHDSDRFQQSDVSARTQLIVDAGFDPFIRENWDTLVSGRRITSDFLVPARLDSVRIGISRTAAGDCGATDTELACFVVRPAGVLRVVGWLVEPIRIGYDLNTRRLQVFDGLSNLRDDQGEPRNALIKFEYF
jgi:hypothetical protein